MWKRVQSVQNPSNTNTPFFSHLFQVTHISRMIANSIVIVHCTYTLFKLWIQSIQVIKFPLGQRSKVVLVHNGHKGWLSPKRFRARCSVCSCVSHSRTVVWVGLLNSLQRICDIAFLHPKVLSKEKRLQLLEPVTLHDIMSVPIKVKSWI